MRNEKKLDISHRRHILLLFSILTITYRHHHRILFFRMDTLTVNGIFDTMNVFYVENKYKKKSNTIIIMKKIDKKRMDG